MAIKFRSCFSEAVEEYVGEMRAAGYSENTINDYQNGYKLFIKTIGDLPFQSITRNHIVQYMGNIRYIDGKCGDDGEPIERANKTIRNYHTALSSLWTWAVELEYVNKHIVRTVKAPEPKSIPTPPYTMEEIHRLAKACHLSTPWNNKPLVQTDQVAGERNYAIVLLLTDTGLRNSELRNVQMDDIDWRNNRIKVRLGKGKKSRYVGFGLNTRRALKRYINHSRPQEAEQRGDYLFVNFLRYKGQKMTRNALSRTIARLGKRADVVNAETHRFRTTAAVLRLKNGMNAFQLKEFLGHSQISTTMRYVHIAQIDMDDAMRHTSPIDSLRL